MKHKLLNLDATSVKFYEGKQGVFSGYASVFGGVDSYGDTIIAGAYEKTITERDRPVQMRWNHYGEIIGKWTRMEEDEIGLYVEGELTPGHSKAQDVYASLMHGSISGMSIGYKPKKFVQNEKGGYDLYEIDLVEVSVVESPADLNAQVNRIKSDVDEFQTYKEFEDLLRESGGLSKGDALWVVEGIKRLSLGEQGKTLAVKESEVSDEAIKLAFYLAQLRSQS
jgi:uncharacterized protein